MNRYQLKPISHRRPFRQRGAATLIVVMLLFFIISMVAAYTSRNLIFEQRTSANQYRSTQAFEAAEAGLEWAVAQLNAGRMSTSCAASAASVLGTIANDSSFARRYLTVDAVSGAVTPIYVGSTRQPQCVFGRSSDTATDWAWRCSCPLSTAGANTLSQPGGSGPTPAFRVRMLDGFDSQQVGPRTDLIQIESNSCTRLADSCLQFDNDDRGGTGDGVARVSALVALRGAITRPPAAALTVAESLAALPAGATLTLTNQDATASGITLHAGGSVPGTGITLVTVAGAPPSSSALSADLSLSPAAAGGFTAPDRRFALYFGVRPDTYFRQPGMVEVGCNGGCNADNVNLALLRNPGRAIRVKGAGTLTIGADIGTASAPALLILDADVDVNFSGGVTFVGLLYGRKSDWTWTVGGAVTIQGAAVAEGGLTLTGGSGATRIVYDAPTLTALRVSYGTFVRVPGSWKDFQ